MGRNETDRAAGDLSTTQLAAIEALLTGATVTHAAREAGVARTTVHRWLRDDWDFQAALNRERRELCDAIRSRLLRAAESSAALVLKAVDGGDVQVALSVLKGLGLLGSRVHVDVGDDDPAALALEASIAKGEIESDRQLRSLMSVVT